MNEDRCALCETAVDTDCFCFGCKHFVCGDHATAWGSHDLDEHKAEDWDDACG